MTMGDDHLLGLVLTVAGSLLTGAISGTLSSQRTISALIVHIDYLKSHIERHENAINRAHSRIDDVERRVA